MTILNSILMILTDLTTLFQVFAAILEILAALGLGL